MNQTVLSEISAMADKIAYKYTALDAIRRSNEANNRFGMLQERGLCCVTEIEVMRIESLILESYI